MKLVLSRSSYLKANKSDLVLLGDYCLPPLEDAARHNIVKHPWRNINKFDEDYDNIQQVYSECLGSLTISLNKFHNTQASVRQWEIMIGPWLRIFLVALHERSELLKASFLKWSIKHILVHDTSRMDKDVFDTSIFLSKIEGSCAKDFDLWSEMLTLDIFKYSGIRDSVTVTKISEIDVPKGCTDPIRGTFRKRLFSALDALVHRRSKILIHRFGRPIKKEFSMFLSARMLPHFSFPDYKPSVESVTDATNFRSKKLEISGTGVDDLLGRLLPKYLPQSFLEHYDSIKGFVHRVYPKRPKVIATSVSYYRDDLFKIYVAQMIAQQTKYIIMQHGGGIGSCKHNDDEELQINTSDVYLTWGWRDTIDQKKDTNLLPVKSSLCSDVIKKGPISLDRNNDAIIIPVSEWSLQTFRMFSAPLSYRQNLYLEQLFELVESAPSDIAKRIRFRLQSGDRGWGVEQKFEARGLGDHILRAEGNFCGDIEGAALSIINTNSTCLLESIGLNFPTIGLLTPELSSLRPSAEKDYLMLEEVGIMHKSVDSALDHLALISDDIIGWWLDAGVQEHLTYFREKYFYNPQLQSDFEAIKMIASKR